MLHVAHSILSSMERYRTKHAVVMMLARVMCAELVRAPSPFTQKRPDSSPSKPSICQLCIESADTVPVWHIAPHTPHRCVRFSSCCVISC